MPVAYLGRDLIVGPGTVYIYDNFTLPAHRGYGLAEAGSAHLMRRYRQQGYRQLASNVAVENIAGLRLNLKRGSRPIGRFSCLRLGPWQRDRLTARGEQPIRIVARRAPRGEPLAS